MKLPTASSVLLFVGLALFAGGVVSIPSADACTVVVGGTCGAGCAPTLGLVSVGCGSNDCGVVVLSDCVAGNSGPGSCTVTVVGPDPRNDCAGSCDVNVGFCGTGGFANDDPGNCIVSVGTCLGNGDCAVNVAYTNAPAPLNGNCNGDCLVNLFGACSSVGEGRCTVNLGTCQGDCTVNGPFTGTVLCSTTGQCIVNLGTCSGACKVNLDTCDVGEVCTLQFGTCRIP